MRCVANGRHAGGGCTAFGFLLAAARVWRTIVVSNWIVRLLRLRIRVCAYAWFKPSCWRVLRAFLYNMLMVPFMAYLAAKDEIVALQRSLLVSEDLNELLMLNTRELEILLITCCPTGEHT